MKSLIIALILTVGAIAAAAQAPQPSASSVPSVVSPPQDENARRARALIDQAIQALGGPAWLNVQDMEQQGRTYSFYHGQPNSVGAPFWRFWKFPDKDRVELTKQRDVVYINNGDNGYEVTYKGTAAQEPESLTDYQRRHRHSLEVVLRQWLKEPGTALFYDGPAVAEQKHTDAVTVMNAHNESVTLFLDSNTHLPIKKTFEWRDKDRYKNEEGEVFDNYRLEQGVMTPHSILRVKNGDISNQRFITSVRYNVGLPDSMFQATVSYDPYKHSGPREKK
jgi:hypothetical protein